MIDLDKRRGGIGGSDWADVLSMEPYGCRRKLIYNKILPPSDHQTGQMIRGHKLEPLILREYELATQRALLDASAHPQLREGAYANADGFVLADSEIRIVEAKSVSSHVYRQHRRYGIPEYWVLQCQHYMTAYGVDSCDLIELCIDDWDYTITTLYSDPDRESKMAVLAVDAMAMIESARTSGMMPDRLPPADKRCGRCQHYARCWADYVPASVGECEDVVDDVLAGLVADYTDACARRADSEREAAEIKRALIERAGIGAKKIGSTIVKISEQERTTVDSKKLKQLYPEQYATCSRKTIATICWVGHD